MKQKNGVPLEMADGFEAKTLDGLKERFSLYKVLLYLKSGKLDVQLRNCYEYEIADELKALDWGDVHLMGKVCNILGNPDRHTGENSEDIREHLRKSELLIKAKAAEIFASFYNGASL